MSKKWNTGEIPSQEGRVAIVTGANSGIGFETTLVLAEKGVTVVMACRNLEKGEEAKTRILQKYPDSTPVLMHIDTADQSSVKMFAESFMKQFTRLDLLINNAGVMMPPYKITSDGFELQLATNYLGHFSLTGQLISMLNNTPEARVINLSSLSYKWSEIQFEDINFEKGYNKSKAYGQSKRACLIFSYELQRRLSAAGHKTLSLAVHPGLANTNLDRYFPAWLRPLGNLFLQSPAMGALPILFAAFNRNLYGSEFIGPKGFKEIRGYPTIVESDSYSESREVGKKLWMISEQMTSVKYLS